MRVLIFTDTHGIFNEIYEKYKNDLPNYDRIILLGDHSSVDINQIMSEFTVPILRINGNHDVPSMVIYKDALPLHEHLIGYTPTYTGWQGSHIYKDTQIYGYTQKESLDLLKTMPKADILFSHDGPYGYCGNKEDFAHCGLKGILKYIKKNKPKTIIYGHHHKFNHYTIKKTECFCVYQIAWFEFDEEGKVLNFKTFEPI